MFHDALMADVPDQLGKMAASLREEKDCLVTGKARCGLDILRR
jgi:hypothetical protein